MYEAYWNLSQRPFDDGAAPGFYYPSPTHQASLLKLRYLIEQNKGIGLLVGDHGLGKSFLMHVLQRECQSENYEPFVRLVVPALNARETLAYLANRLGANIKGSDSSDEVLLALEAKLKELAAQKQHPVFIIDDAHLLDVEQLNLIRLFLNLHEDGAGRFSVILAGRVDLLAKVKRLKSLDQRVSVRMALQPLSESQVENYISHRMETAGATQLFDARASQSIWELSQGIPRRINQICDLSLLVGYVDQLRTITPLEIETAADEILCVKE
ncbi:MAG: AAA family ATPase [Planctomicrobium sp.]|jgi:MSHA biogenesis protein MshM|nr:AAA family ATPase [Planctomicrobium sp.]